MTPNKRNNDATCQKPRRQRRQTNQQTNKSTNQQEEAIAYFILAEEVISKCILVIARNFSHIVHSVSDESVFQFLPPHVMLTLLNHGSLAVMSEYVVYQTVCDYIHSKGDDLTKQEKESLFETVRFPYLNYVQLEEVIKTSVVPHSIVAEALMVRLGMELIFLLS
jgi:hypothetical protein